jgi:nucleotide-binding universal stress UspA family protein
MAEEIVLGYDDSDGSKAALEEALRLCAQLNADLVVTFGYHVAVPERQSADYRHALEEIAEKATRAAADRAAAAGVTAHVEIRAERAAEALVNVADERGARMIVLGSHGQTPLKGALLGSTSHRLLHLSTKPVLVVRG